MRVRLYTLSGEFYHAVCGIVIALQVELIARVLSSAERNAFVVCVCASLQLLTIVVFKSKEKMLFTS